LPIQNKQSWYSHVCKLTFAVSTKNFVLKYLLVYPIGGLLICLPHDKAQSYCDELQCLDGQPAWIVGEVVPGNRQAKMQTDLKIIEV